MYSIGIISFLACVGFFALISAEPAQQNPLHCSHEHHSHRHRHYHYHHLHHHRFYRSHSHGPQQPLQHENPPSNPGLGDQIGDCQDLITVEKAILPKVPGALDVENPLAW